MIALLISIVLDSAAASPFRVLVFPHRGVYSSPQGRETTISKVKITSDEVCNQYLAELNSKSEWVKTGDLVDSKKSFSLTTKELKTKMNTFVNPTNAFYFECTKPFTVHRDVKLQAYSYEGNFVAIIGQGGSGNLIQIINLIGPEKYIQGVVPAEVGNNWPVEALKAQAVAARTFAWWTVLNERETSGLYYDLDDTIQYQAYSGTLNHTEATDSAVTDTAEQVITYNGSVIKAYYSADSGGKTESASNVFEQKLPYCISKMETYDLSKTKTDWETLLSLEEIGLVFAKNIKKIEVESGDINTSGRVDQVTIITNDDQKTKVSGRSFRLALKLRSTLFVMQTETVNNQEFIRFTGKGYGHGVGMAQVGAKQYALQFGWTFDQILKFYYTGVTIETATNDFH